MRIALTLIVWASTIAPASVDAQARDSVSIPLGASVRVRVNEWPPGRIFGTFAGADSTGVSVVERWNKPSVVVRWETIEHVDVGRRRSASEAFGRGARVGAIVSGSIAVVAITAAVWYDVSGECGECIPPVSVIIVPASFVFTIAGTVLGGVLAIPLDHDWTEVWRPRR